MAVSDLPALRWAKLLDQSRCIGCHACTTACKSENEVPVGVTRTYVKSMDVGVFPQARRAFQVTRCNQCEDAPCVAACPTQAMYRREDGIVDFDKSICIGCKATLDPLAARRPDGGLFAWATQGALDPQLVTSGHPGRTASSAAALLSYDVPHQVPWGWRVSVYTWTSSIAAGSFAVPVALAFAGVLAWGNAAVRWAARRWRWPSWPSRAAC